MRTSSELSWVVRGYWKYRRYWMRVRLFYIKKQERINQEHGYSDICVQDFLASCNQRILHAEEILDRIYPRWREQVEMDKLRQELAEYHAQDLRLLQRRLRTHQQIKLIEKVTHTCRSDAEQILAEETRDFDYPREH